MIIYVHTRPTLRDHLERKRRIRKMGEDVIPRDKSWQVYLTFAAVVLAFAVMFVRWWTI